MSRLWILIFLLSLPVFAQEELEVIEVETVKDIDRFTFGDANEIPERDIETASTALIAPAIEKTPGIVTTQNGGPGGTVSFFIRGTEGRHVGFTLDGLKLNDSSNTGRLFDAAFMTSPFLRDVTVHKGPQAVLFGSDAMGGVVELKSRKGENAPETRVLINGGSFGTIDGTVSSDWKKKDHNGTVTLTRFHTDGISRLNEKRFNATEADSADITQATSSSEHKWAKKWQTDFLFSYLHGKNELDGATTDTKNDHSINDQYLVQQKTSYELNDQSVLLLRNGLNRNQRFIRMESTGPLPFEGNLYQNELVHRLELPQWGFLTGVSNEHETSSTTSVDKSFDLNSFFLQSAFKSNDFKLQAGGRADHHSQYGEFVTGSGGVAYKDFSVQYSQGFKAPSLYQLYAPVFGNKDLVPERNHSWEVSWRKSVDEWSGGITFFQNRLSNLINYSFVDNAYFNQGKFIAEGVELSAGWKSDRFEVVPTFTHQKFRENEEPVLRRPYNMAQLSFSYFPVETIELNATGRWFSSRKDIDENFQTVKLNGYSVLDIGAKKTWIRDEVGVQVKNVLDREYEELYGYSVLPFSVFVHYGHKF
ncbi:TonB-dependent receptor plug domain-containing protein [Peredibacter starrii]|uniref:TonB-dependent receptor n=1 Tax=Peredibacter starrii TaxID=28202 RepID=A0AAX4HMX5_9BACT|nr:TonB-dependent receptor [Peredibacter starrii]WPU64630.1 TonB-dependent receptor [Peredibacter starrii]